MDPLELTSDQFRERLAPLHSAEHFGAPGGHPLVVLRDGSPVPSPGPIPVVVCAIGDGFGAPGPDGVDLVVGAEDLHSVHEAVMRAPLAATALVVHLRAMEAVPSVEAGLAFESALYSALQAGPEFAAWRAATPGTVVDDREPTVIVGREGARLHIVLDRPHRHNAVSTRLRDELHAALTVPVVDDTISSIVLAGNGPSFCSGGDLDEFGSRPDPATAHASRLARSPSLLIHRLADKMTAVLHGAAMGGGIEMAAFAGRVTAHPETVVALPEISLGLVPGAGGTVSLPRRIGRARTAALALTGRRLDAATALEWGLVDAVDDRIRVPPESVAGR